MIQCVCHNQCVCRWSRNRDGACLALWGLILRAGAELWGTWSEWNKSFLCLVREREHQLLGSGLVKQEKGLLKVNHPVLENLSKFSPSVWLSKQWVKRLESEILIWGWVVFHAQLAVWVRRSSAWQWHLCLRARDSKPCRSQAGSAPLPRQKRWALLPLPATVLQMVEEGPRPALQVTYQQ